MKLQTRIPQIKATCPIDYDSRVFVVGSCFSENIGKKLAHFKFRSFQNPLGILFHPVAIENLITRAVQNSHYSDKDIFLMNARWQTFEAHSSIGEVSKEQLLRRLDQNVRATRLQLEQATHVIITLGTAWVYTHVASQQIVANCHKVPQKEFSKELLSVDTIVDSLKNIVNQVHGLNDRAKFIFTVSPVRHLKDGFVENQRSKAHLITAVHEVIENENINSAVYFPSYELLMDELRDYRFYDSDMVHPSTLAIDYVWERFKLAWISPSVFSVMDEIDTIQKGLGHRPFHGDSEAHLNFKKLLQTKIEKLRQSYPFMNFEG
ncbi:GSCFA domain-containing protein [Pareuzebyella sediminis]|uniref:GSCFA domain-containing protein n=1 Tax=Pareuzebyella sediminis TaxID=2607998 RepID=UPI0011EC6E98|nr:GSCFA domain-containing protein [Pareuzebyella sediminis]